MPVVLGQGTGGVAEMAGGAGVALTVTLVEFVAVQPEELATTRVKPRMPGAPAV